MAVAVITAITPVLEYVRSACTTTSINSICLKGTVPRSVDMTCDSADALSSRQHLCDSRTVVQCLSWRHSSRPSFAHSTRIYPCGMPGPPLNEVRHGAAHVYCIFIASSVYAPFALTTMIGIVHVLITLRFPLLPVDDPGRIFSEPDPLCESGHFSFVWGIDSLIYAKLLSSYQCPRASATKQHRQRAPANRTRCHHRTLPILSRATESLRAPRLACAALRVLRIAPAGSYGSRASGAPGINQCQRDSV